MSKNTLCDKKLSIVVIKTDSEIELILNSIIRQKGIDFSQIEVIVEDSCEESVSTKTIEAYADKFYISYEHLPDAELYELYNAGLNKVKGAVVNFIISKAFYATKDVLRRGMKASVSSTVVVNVGYYDADTNERTPYTMQPLQTERYNLEAKSGAVCLNLNGYFINTKLIKDLKFSEKYYDECDIKFILDFIRKNKDFTYLNKTKITSYEPFENNTSKGAVQYKSWWYNESLDNYYNEIKDFLSIPAYFQEAVMYLVFAKINSNFQERNKGVIAKENFEELMARIMKVVCLLDDCTIVQMGADADATRVEHLFKIPRWVSMYLLARKNEALGINVSNYATSSRMFYVGERDGLKVSKTLVANLLMQKVNVRIINKVGNKLQLDCTTTVVDFLNDCDFDLYAMLSKGENDASGRRIEVERSEIYPLLRIFGKTIARMCRFIIEVDLSEVKNGEHLAVYADYQGVPIKHMFSFSSIYAKLSNFSNSFWDMGEYILLKRSKSICFIKKNPFSLLKREVKFELCCLLRSKMNPFSVRYIKMLPLICFRWFYYLSKPFFKNKHIWITWDKLYKAGDNGEYMYQYCLKNTDENIYYMIKKDSPDYARLKSQNRKRILVYKSFKARFYALHSEVILNTHANIASSCGFDNYAYGVIGGFFNPEVICIQHGLTIQRIAQFQNRLFDNIRLYCCASPYEVENISGEMYGYSPESIKLTGLARYDGLKSNDQKIILITPTWRRNVVNSSVAHFKKSHNDNFKNSEYFKIYNSLINNKELIECANQTGYKIIYLLHPAMSGQLEDFDKNEYVDIIPATGDINYEKILTESSLMVTDYSGVQFDFAYQRKPLVYYHPDRLPPHYDAGIIDHETMGFGPICKNEKQVVAELCDYMRNECRIKQNHKENADRFFAFDDFNNCERIHATIKEYLKGIGRI